MTKKANEFFDRGDGVCEIFLYNTGIKNYIVKALIDSEEREKCESRRWFLTKDGYVRSFYRDDNGKKTTISLHNLVLNRNSHKKFIVDHINRNKLDNRKINLRICTQGLNQINAKIEKRNKSGYPGVYKTKRAKNTHKWVSVIGHNNAQIYLGTFESKELAIMARKKAEIELFGTNRYD